jgi:ketosteroid isomerase-like protein
MPAPTRPTLHATPEDAESAFYEALERSDTEAMMAVWSEDEDTVCVHPTGAQLLGTGLIRDSWRNIFTTARLRVASVRVAHWQGMLLAIHHLVETVYIGEDTEPHGPLFVTHVYSRGAHGWRLVNRHASAAGEAHSTEGDDDGDTPRVLH